MGDIQLGVGRGEIGLGELLIAGVLALAFFAAIIFTAYLIARRGRDD